MGCRVSCTGGATLMEVARSAGIFLASVCGGQGTCGRCKVRIVAGTLPAPDGRERSRLSGDEIAAGFRLACAVRVVEDLKVSVPTGSLASTARVQLSGEGIDLAADPVVSAYDLVVPESSSRVPANAWDVLQKALRETPRSGEPPGRRDRVPGAPVRLCEPAGRTSPSWSVTTRSSACGRMARNRSALHSTWAPPPSLPGWSVCARERPWRARER